MRCSSTCTKLHNGRCIYLHLKFQVDANASSCQPDIGKYDNNDFKNETTWMGDFIYFSHDKVKFMKTKREERKQTKTQQVYCSAVHFQ